MNPYNIMMVWFMHLNAEADSLSKSVLFMQQNCVFGEAGGGEQRKGDCVVTHSHCMIVW